MSWIEQLNSYLFKDFLLNQYKEYLLDKERKMVSRISKSQFTMEVDWPLHKYLNEIRVEIAFLKSLINSSEQKVNDNE